jgi:[acyl-carrier-protein] S-malonyltransferase
MAAVLGLAPEKVRELCEQAAQGEVVACANFNEPAQTVIAGHAKAVERAGELLKAAGARRVLPLPVSAPFHCALMEPVVPRLGEVLRGMAIKPLAVPVVTNVEAAPNQDAGRVVDLLLRQVTGSVRWIGCVQAMEQAGVTKMVELGPGKVLCGLVKRISRAVECVNVEDPASLEKALAALGG